MQYGYVIKIANKQIYREIQLPVDAERMKIGLGIDCDVRFYKEQFFEDFELMFFKSGEQWQIACSDNIYIDEGDVRKLVTKKLKHGDSFSLKYQNSESELFKVDFVFDFDNENKDYERVIDISAASVVSIGSAPNCNIALNSQYVKNDYVELKKSANGLLIQIKSTTYGVYINGKQAKNGEVIKNYDFFSISDFSFYYKNGQLLTSKNVRVNGLNYFDNLSKGTYPKFIKNVRVHGKISEEEIEILDPAAKQEKPKNNLFMSLLPSMGMLLSSGGMMLASGGSGTMMAFSGISAGMAVLTAVLGFVDNNKEYKKSLEKRISDYNAYIEKKRAEIDQFRFEEKTSLEKLFLNSTVEQQLFDNFSSDLFDRQLTDGDYLFVRLGSGLVKAKREIKYKKQEKLENEDELQMIPEQIKEEYALIKDAPVVCDFKNAGAISIIGTEENRQTIFRNIILDLCARQFFSDVEMIFVAQEENREKINWLRFLPQVNNPVTGMRNIVCDDESKSRTFDYLYKELSIRESDNRENPVRKQIVVFLYDEYGFQNHPISKFVEQGKKLGVTFVFMVDNRSLAPTGSSQLIELKSHNQGVLIDTLTGEKPCEFTFEPISEATIRRVVDILAPVFTEEISLEGSLTKNISLFEMLNILMVSDIDLKSNWGSSQVFKSMAAPIGVTKNEYIYLDLHDKAHGPHGLVAGTTGSGKSEILQTYILSMATLFHPYEVGFVIIDFKGGGMVNQFADLPHLMGAITNIDGKEIDRSLKSIKAELQKRQRYFAEAEVNHIDKYIKKFKAGEVTKPLPHLILIVDEFAELKAEQPEFMKELISAARIGRSLGVHLILATQKPAGQVDDQIWSNSRFKLCLKVQGVEDSNEVLKSPLAAEIKEPGRAYFQVGNNEIFELFQSAYSGAPEKNTDTNVKAFSVNQVSDTGKRIQVFSQKKKKSDGANITQLDAIVRHVHNYCQNNHIERLPNICLPSLESVISYPEHLMYQKGLIDIGIYDDPDNQLQDSTWIDVENKNTIIIGSSQYGKTNLLQSFIKTIASNTTPKQSVFYILDFGSMVLKNFEKLNHVGGVVTSSEDEKLKNLFKLLFEEMNNRKERLLEVGVSSFSSYIEAGYEDIPHIYLIIDNMTALSELYLEDDDSLLMIIRDGLAVGISTIMANVQTTGISYKYMSNFANKISLYCNDPNEYTNIFDHISLQPDEKPGRCILEIDKRMLECQTYLAFEGEKEIERVTGIRDFVDSTNAKNQGMNAKQIPCIPNVLTKGILYDDFGAQSNQFSLPIGLTYADVKPFYIDLAQLGIMGICGRDGFGHKNFVTYLFDCLKEKDAEIVVFDDISKKFAPYKEDVNFYSLNTDAINDVVTQWHEELEGRYNRMLLEESVPSDKKLLLMIVQNNDVAAKIQSDMDISNMFNDIIERYKNMGVCIIFSNYPNAAVSYDAPDAIRAIKQSQHIICLDDLQNLKCFDPPYDAIRENKKPISVGSGYYINDNVVVKLKLVLSEEA